jgi:hypothetical protein
MGIEVKEGINSYCSLEFAENYISGNYSLGSTWETLDESNKARLLITATANLDNLTFRGLKEKEEQPLAFPRIYPQHSHGSHYYYHDHSSYQIYDHEIPTVVKKAECEMAIHLLNLSKDQIAKFIKDGIGDIQIGELRFSSITKNNDRVPLLVKELLGIFLYPQQYHWERG